MKNIFFTFLVILSIPIYSQTNWVPLNSPGGADVNNIFKVTDSVFICGIQNGSLYRTSNSGQSWAKVWIGNNNYGNTGVIDMILNSNNDILVSTYDKGILISFDTGLTWQVTDNSAWEAHLVNTQSGILLSSDNNRYSWDFGISLDSGKTWMNLDVPWNTTPHPTNSMVAVVDTIYLGMTDSILYTKDFGNSWEKFGNRISGPQRINKIIFINENQVMVGTNIGVYFSSDKGITWQTRNTGLINTSKKITNLIMRNDSIYASTSSGIYFTTDYGNQWIHFNNYNFQREVKNLDFLGNDLIIASNTGVYKVDSQAWYSSSAGIYGITPKSLDYTGNSDLFYCTSTGIFKSTNQGIDWFDLDLTRFWGECTFIFNANNYFIQSSDRLFYLSTDFGNNWINTGSFIVHNTCLAFSKDNDNIYISFFKDNWPYAAITGIKYSSDFGANWNYMNDAYGYDYYKLFITLPMDFLISDIYNFSPPGDIGLYRTTNLGVNWMETNSGLSSTTNLILSADNNYDLYVSQSSGIYKLNRTNFTWELFANNVMNNTTHIIFNKNNDMVVINDGQIFISTDGKKWYSGDEGLENINIKIIETNSLGYFYAVDSGGRIYKTLTPHLLNQLPSSPVLSYPINNQQVVNDTIKFIWNSSDPLVTKYKFIISEDSLFSTTTDTTIADTIVTLFNLDANQKYFWKVSAYNEVGWGIESGVASFITGLTDVEADQILPGKFSLQQNYPNPFNPSTNIQYAISDRQFVTLKVYDVLGKEIATLVNEEKPAGSFETVFNASQLASGIYYYLLRAGDYVETKKMILLK